MDDLAELRRRISELESREREHARVTQALTRRNRELEMLNRVITTATSTLDAEGVLQVACKELAHAFDLSQAAVLLFDAEGQTATVVAEYSPLGCPRGLGHTLSVAGTPLAEYIVGQQAPLDKSDVLNDTQRRALADLLRGPGSASLLLLPIPVARDRVAGALILETSRRHAFSEEERMLAHSVTAAAGHALETSRLYRALYQNVERLEETVAQRTIALQEALEQVRKADRAKSEFVSNVSHELRTPLTNIKLYLNLLTSGTAEKQPFYVDTLHREAGRLQDLVEGLLDISRLDLGETHIDLQPTDLNQVLNGLVVDRAALVNDRGLEMDVKLDAALPAVQVDPKMIQQVLSNLLTNAINYTPAGGAITLRTGTAKVDGTEWATVSVADTGPGISDGDREHLFDRFYRGEAGRKNGVPGTGLGLAICKEIMDLHGGRVTLESQVGRGSTFLVWLPAKN
jgi:signal transduction histidine kinase